MNGNLLILGAGQYGHVVKEIAEDMKLFDKIAFLDDERSGENIVGKLNKVNDIRDEYKYAIPAIGNSECRMKILTELKNIGYTIPCIISPYSYVSKSASIGEGVVIEPLAGVHSNVTIHDGTYISMGAIVNHDACVMKCSHIDNNAVVMSGVIVKALKKIQPGEVVKNCK